MRNIVLLCAVLGSTCVFSQEKTESQTFWENLQKYCGKSYEGEIIKGGREGDGFTGNRLVMQVLSCKKNEIKIPFYVGNDKSRTWVFTKDNEQLIQLKHDHRHQDGTEDKVTQYGGKNPNHGFANLQMFPADKETADRISYASTNVWWVTLDGKIFTYNLRRIGSDRVFSVSFDITKPIDFNEKPWGWNGK